MASYSYAKAAATTVELSARRPRDRSTGSIIFVCALWFSLFFGVLVLLVLVADTAIKGAPRFDGNLITHYSSTLFPDRTGFRAGILGTVWVMIVTAALAVPLGILAALHLEEFADRSRWYNRFIEVNLQNLAAVPSVVYGLLAVAFVEAMGLRQRGLVISGAVALSLLVLPVIIITTREAVRAVPREIREGSLALGATQWQTTWRQTLPSAVPGIATGTILGLSRAIGEAAPLLMIGTATAIRFDPNGLMSQFTALPLEIYSTTSQSQEAFRTAAAAAIIVLLVMILGLNALAIFIRNKFSRSW
jgi:phosphate ABC transporter permease subunit PstA